MRLIRTWCKQVFIGTIMALLAVFFCVATSAKAEQDGVKQSHWGVPSSPAVVNPVVQWSGTKILSLNGDWDFMTTTPWRVRLGLGDPGWGNRLVDWSSARKITVPGLWETQGVGEAGPGLAWDCEWDRGFWDLKHVYMGTAAYRKLIDIPADWGGGQIWLKVGGVRSEASIWVNGKRAAYVKNYCATEKFNITPFVKAGEKAVIIAMVRNDSPSRKGLYSANHRFGGFYRDVELELTPNIRLDNVWIKGNFDKREAQVEFLVRSSNDTEHKPVSAAFVVKTPDGKIVGKTGMANIKPVSDSVSAPLPVVLHCGINPCRFWSPEEPNLYIAQLELYDASGKIVHGQVERFGVRKLEVIGDKFYLNGKPYFLRGSGDHNYDCNSIIEPPNRLRFLEHMKIYKAAGFNFMRHHTHCPLPEYFEAADEAGILLMPELPYYHDVPTEAFGFDPVSDAKELFLNYRRYVSFAVYSGGNEGHLGSPVDEQLYQWVKKNDPQRLVVHQDGGRNLASNSDFSNGPISPWETCKQDELDRPFVAHEYLNLAIKMDPRQEPRFTGARVSPVSMEKYKALLKQTGLNETWGAACIAAAERLQAIYQKQGLESARLDPACDGYSFWSIVDASIPQGETVAAQGYLNPFWEPRPNGLKPAEFVKFNGPTAILLKTVPKTPVASSGDTIETEFCISHYGANDIPACELTWKLTSGKDTIASSTVPIKAVKVGYAGSIAKVSITVPDLKKPEHVKLVAELTGTKCPNDWDFWLFPKRKRPSLSGVVVSPSMIDWFQKRYDQVIPFGDAKMKPNDAVIARTGDPLLRQAINQGRNILVITPASPKANVSLGWWGIGTQVGTAFAEHPVFGTFPKSAAMDQLWFKLIRVGAPDLRQGSLPRQLEPLAVGEGRDSYYLYLGQGKCGSASVLTTYAMDLLQDRPEALWLLDSMISYIMSDKFAPKTTVTELEMLKGK